MLHPSCLLLQPVVLCPHPTCQEQAEPCPPVPERYCLAASGCTVAKNTFCQLHQLPRHSAAEASPLGCCCR